MVLTTAIASLINSLIGMMPARTIEVGVVGSVYCGLERFVPRLTLYVSGYLKAIESEPGHQR